jgi:hypothetical protein
MMTSVMQERAVGCLRRINESNQFIGKLDEGGFPVSKGTLKR